jgi:hypothetical protein
MTYLFANNAAGTLAAPITNSSATLTLNVGQAVLFPNPSAPDTFQATITDAATQTLIEIVSVTAVSGNIFSIVRAQEGTTARSWNANDIVSQRATALELTGFQNATEGNFTTVPLTPSQTMGIIGTTTNNNANAGSVGEFITASITGEQITTSLVSQNITSISLTAGDWDVDGNIEYVANGVTQLGLLISSVSTTSAVGQVAPFRGSFNPNVLSSAGAYFSVAAPKMRMSLAATTTVYLVGTCQTTGSTTAAGYIQARRVR